ncbi:hypothetical protein BLNAU_8816 [Blattamonas nauphoetae]|uniref:Uncharacterized protein n=1 Tax=Blattamonas nauphoetae TaxID=2049346 RepID=A0ABQ9XXM5_9EUKA|nr:hypothetical protein BLNAU_8816 [Blattamonas nauphoetae]
MIIFPSLNNWLDDDLLVPPTDEFMEEWKKHIDFDPSAYLERLKGITRKVVWCTSRGVRVSKLRLLCRSINEHGNPKYSVLDRDVCT